MKILSFALLLWLCTTATRVDGRGFAYYDVGRLYDTIPSPHYNDRAYTPNGEKRWNSNRYNLKVESIASVIDSLRLPIVALFGVESEAVVRDITARTSQEYSYIHRTLDYYDGLDFALLYFGDRFFVDYVRSGNTWLYVAAQIDEITVDIYLTRRGSKLRQVTPIILGRSPQITIVAGDLTTRDLERLKLYDTMGHLQREGYGTSRGERGWYFDSRIGTTLPIDGLTYASEWLISSSGERPLGTFDRANYLGGFSHHLPMLLLF